MIIDSHPMPYSCVMSDAPGPDFADLIANARKNKGWSQDRLHEESGVDRSTISRWERRLTDKPEPEHVRAVCKALDIDPRQAAVSLGYLTLDEIQPLAPLPPKIKEVLDILEDPRVGATTKQEWIDYLIYLRNKTQSPADAG